MRLAEHDGKTLLRRHGVPVPPGRLLTTAPPPDAAGVLKAQVLAGGRGKRGLVRRVALGEAPAVAAAIRAALGDPAAPLLLEDAVPIARELYFALRVDGTAQAIELMLIPEGGVAVEQAGAALLRCHLDADAPGALATVHRTLCRGLPPGPAPGTA